MTNDEIMIIYSFYCHYVSINLIEIEKKKLKIFLHTQIHTAGTHTHTHIQFHSHVTLRVSYI